VDPLIQVARDLDRFADADATAFAERVHGRITEFGRRGAVTPLSREVVRGLVRAFAATLSGSAPAVPAGALEYTRAYVHRGIELTTLLRAVRVGHAELWRVSAALLAEQDPPDVADQQRRLADALFAFVDVVAQQVSQEHEQERRRWVADPDTVRLDTARAILDGTPLEVASASARLGYELAAHHLGLVVWADEPALRSTVAGALRALRSGPVLVVAPASREVWAWLAVAPGTDPVALLADRLPGLAVAVGEPAVGVDGFRATHRNARFVQRSCARAGTAPGTPVHWRDAVVGGLLCAEPEQARQFLVRELGELDGDDPFTGRLRQTLLVWLQEQDRRRTAARLGVHPNTVAHRLRRCQSLLGRGLRERAFELELALRLRDVLPSETRACPPRPGMIQMGAGTRGEQWNLARRSI
jgi:hypothetical protein